MCHLNTHTVPLEQTLEWFTIGPGMLYNRPWKGLQQAMEWFTTGSGMVYNRPWNGLQQALKWFKTGHGMIYNRPWNGLQQEWFTSGPGMVYRNSDLPQKWKKWKYKLVTIYIIVLQGNKTRGKNTIKHCPKISRCIS